MDINKFDEVSKLVRLIDEIDSKIGLCKNRIDTIWKIRAKSPICAENFIKEMEFQIKDFEIDKDKLKDDFIKL